MVDVIEGDCPEVMRGMEENSVDSVVTDPPASIAFMGKDWDRDKGGRDKWVAWMAGVMRECLRVLKPGGSAFVWAIPRRSHWTAMALEDAGFCIRDKVYHHFGSGFPKSRDISKAIDKARGAKRGSVGLKVRPDGTSRPNKANWTVGGANTYAQDEWTKREMARGGNDITAPATDLAREWDGYGTALKPATEEWIWAMAPLDGTFAGNAEKHGVAGLWIEGSRVPSGDDTTARHSSSSSYLSGKIGEVQPKVEPYSTGGTSGRWPANLVLSHHPECERKGVKRVRGQDGGTRKTGKRGGNAFGEWSDGRPEHGGYKAPDGTETVADYACHEDCPVRMLGEQSGVRKSGPIRKGAYRDKATQRRKIYGGYDGYENAPYQRDTGTAARFFHNFSPDGDQTARFLYCPKASRRERNAGMPEGQTNGHPTVKPIKLMEWLLTLTKTPTGGTVLDPFAGSGTTGVAAANLGRDCILIEKDPDYCEIARRRVAHAEKNKQPVQEALRM